MVTVIAEIGSVHDGSFGNAQKLIAVAAECGADAVKFQTHIAEAETLRDAPAPAYFSDEPRFDYFRRTAFTLDQWRRLAADCEGRGVTFLSSPFSLEAVDLLEQVGVGAYKVPSGEVTNLPLLERIAATGKPVYLSSGMSDWRELDEAVEALKGGGQVTVLQCSSAYPCPPERVGLNVIGEMAERWGLPVGFSDHTDGPAAAIAAVALGASVVEKHITFSRLMYGSDAANATEPPQFREFVQALRAVQKMRANPVDKDDLTPYRDMKKIFEKSVVAARDLPEGHVLGEGDLAYKKPGDGLPARRWRDVLGRRLVRDVKADQKLSEGDLASA
ncbi:N-acetylneuraminate synthase family protein [Afifella sp. IM 167]|uniref:N-acetylneuraminate synthase family protein n=1 Tax=Afifella sp. IM 167 TaxID=2033586 RepID=UPI001CC9EE0E|nr:N-acetylneuraminate synthase family protein [Afifella sp. IM 167]MBZ8134248.1 N-acetylneuraminate synthase [Afifella sp. IM 167]